MVQRGRPGLSQAQKKELWRRWKEGQSLSEIARALGKHPGSIHGVIKANGGIVPVVRSRALRVLSLVDREEISRGLAEGESLRTIAGRIGRVPSTVCREVARHGGVDKYRAVKADDRAWANAKRPKTCVLATNPPLQQAVASKLGQDWSPKQITGWLVVEYPGDETMRVSHETIYRSLFLQARGVLKKELVAHLRHVRTMRSSRNASHQDEGRGGIIDAVSIHDRPAEIEDRAIPGHWEGDLIQGCHNTFIATLVERNSRFVKLVKVDGKDTNSVVGALIREAHRLPEQLLLSLTWDRGMELASHKTFTFATNMKVYFADPKSPWQRRSNENTNGLLRQYFPKGSDLSGYSQDQLDAIAMKLNTRPRQTLGYITPAARLQSSVASTG